MRAGPGGAGYGLYSGKYDDGSLPVTEPRWMLVPLIGDDVVAAAEGWRGSHRIDMFRERLEERDDLRSERNGS